MTLLRITALRHGYGGQTVLDGVDLAIPHGGALGLVGGSGSGKTTLGRLVLGLERVQSGAIERDGTVQAVFQDPGGSLDPRMTAAASVAEAVRRAPGPERRARAAEALDEVGLGGLGGALPHQLSGGQRQRVAIARALVARPALVVADEALSALDASLQAQVIALLRDLRARHAVGWLFISHDIAALRHVVDEIAVLHDGRIVERGPVSAILAAPAHPYTRALVAASWLPCVGQRP